MCGVLGLVYYGKSAPTYVESKIFRKAVTALLKHSQIRGTDATGLLLMTDSKAFLFKSNLTADDFVSTIKYSNVIRNLNKFNYFRAIIGHTRSKTKGMPIFNINNHPITANRIVGVHNGVIANDDFLFDKHINDLYRKGRVDSEIIFRLLDLYRQKKETIVESVKKTCDELIGSYACAFVDMENTDYVTLFTNKGDISILIYEALDLIVFASSTYILNRALHNNAALDPTLATHNIEMGTGGIRINTRTGKLLEFDLNKKKQNLALVSSARSGGCVLEEMGCSGLYSEGCDHLCNACPYYEPKEN